jgi:hypothetical protein
MDKVRHVIVYCKEMEANFRTMYQIYYAKSRALRAVQSHLDYLHSTEYDDESERIIGLLFKDLYEAMTSVEVTLQKRGTQLYSEWTFATMYAYFQYGTVDMYLSDD